MSKMLELRGVLTVDAADGCGCDGGAASLDTLMLALRCGASSFEAIPLVRDIQIQTQGVPGLVWVELPITQALTAIDVLVFVSSAPVKLRIGAAPAELAGVAGTFPTGFAGGETLDLTIDAATLFTTTFTSGAQTAVQVAQEINAAAIMAGFAFQPASVVNGQLQIAGVLTGPQGLVDVAAGSAATTLGLTGSVEGSGQDVDVYGLFLAEFGKQQAPARIQVSGQARVTVVAAGSVS